MSARVRQLIFSVVLCGFILGLLWILLYSSGYRINWFNFTVQPTGHIRVAIEPSTDTFTVLLPTGSSSTDATVSFTHLTPGDYNLHVEAPDYLPVNLDLTVKPNKTLVIEPLRLWPDAPTKALTVAITPRETTSEAVTTADIPIAYQAALAQITSGSDQNQYVVANDQVVVLDAMTHQVTLLSQIRGIMTSRVLDDDTIQLIALDQPDQILLRSAFSLTLASLSDDQFDTLTRVSQPLVAAAAITGTPYIAYADNTTVHILDSRSQGNYLDQQVATVSGQITNLDYNAELDSLVIIMTDATLLYPLTVAT